MQTIVEYIMMNYIWIIFGSIIILLAIIGYYADKTNFGQGKPTETESKEFVDISSLQGKRMEDLFGHNDASAKKTIVTNTNTPEVINQTTTTATSNNKLDNSVDILQDVEYPNTYNKDNQIDSLKQSEEKFEKFDKEFNELIPKKEIIDGDLLDDVNNLSFDKTQKIQISDITNIDDVELPEIKKMSLEEDDIWKF